MDLPEIVGALRQEAPAVVFVNVLLQQLGLPVPAIPTLLLAGSLAAAPASLAQLLAVSVAASVAADLVWYAAGKAFGYRVLGGLCRMSINPLSCVSQTEARFTRWGVTSLLVAKFVPGFSTVAPPIAGALRMPLSRFVLAAAAGAGLWAGLALAAGWSLRSAVPEVIATLDRNAPLVLSSIAALLVLWLAWKVWQKRRFRALSAIPRVSAGELIAALATDTPPLVLDLRGAGQIAQSGAIPGAVLAEHDRLHEAVGDWPVDRAIVTLCACPEDASAVQAATRLIAQGYRSVRPLAGGYEAWRAAAQTDAAVRITGAAAGDGAAPGRATG